MASFQYLSRATLIFARDRQSQIYLTELGIPDNLVFVSPDFTLDSQRELPYWNPESGKVALVPNQRFVDKGGWGKDYIDLMVSCISIASGLGLEVELVVHEDGDLRLAELIARASGDCSIRTPAGYEASRAIFSAYRFVISCRYHALVAAMSSGVPAIALGWSHKYKGLMEDYEVPELYCDLSHPDQLGDLIARIATSSDEIRAKLLQGRENIIRANHEMWRMILDTVRSVPLRHV